MFDGELIFESVDDGEAGVIDGVSLSWSWGVRELFLASEYLVWPKRFLNIFNVKNEIIVLLSNRHVSTLESFVTILKYVHLHKPEYKPFHVQVTFNFILFY